MSTYVIGDIQGCYPALEGLLDTVGFDPTTDRLWLVGDLVNRGAHSLEVLRWARGLGEAAVTILGNHDLHLLTVAEGFRTPHRSDTLEEILKAPDREELLGWLRTRPLAHFESGWLMVHAGVLPQWTAQDAIRASREVGEVLRGPDYRDFLRTMYGNSPERWDSALAGTERLRVIVNALTRMRFLHPDGGIDLHHKGPPGSQPQPLVPWFEFEGRRTADVRIVCGHWSALGLHLTENFAALDSGCLWGGSLSAIRLEDGRLYAFDCAGLPGTALPK